MDTKSKVIKPGRVWICFFLAVNLISIPLFGAFAALLRSGGSFEAIRAPFISDFKDTSLYQAQTGRYFSLLMGLANSSQPVDDSQIAIAKRMLNQEGDNLRYYALNPEIGLSLENLDQDPVVLKQGEIATPPPGYGYFIYFDGEKIVVMDNGEVVDTERLESGYRDMLSNFNNVYYYQTTEFGYGRSVTFQLPDTDTPSLASARVLLAVNDVLGAGAYGQSVYEQDQKYLGFVRWTYPALSILGLLLLIYALSKWPEKREFDHRLAVWSGRLWLEAKLSITLLVLMVWAIAMGNVSFADGQVWSQWLNLTALTLVLLAGLWWFYLLAQDLFLNRSSFFAHNILTSLVRWYLKYENRASWQKSMLRRVYLLLAVEGVLALISVIFLLASTHSGEPMMFLIAVMIAAAGIYLLYQYCVRYNQTVYGLELLFGHIAALKDGQTPAKLELSAEHDLYTVACNLNSIQEGMTKAVEDKMRSERMKVDLITNVSHDLKTPLTSIISYVELLEREPDLPPHVIDYVSILAQKSQRLQNLIQDLFDLSKASSDNLTVETEKLDLGRLIKQTLADMEEPIENSGLAFRVNIPDKPVYIISDGKKLYRVWENLISNALKYALPGSRVYIDLTTSAAGAVAAIKNTANYEMDFSADVILQRFVRGDQSRSTEGSGLGLSIAQSFAAICGAQLELTIDGDLFKIELRFKEVLRD